MDAADIINGLIGVDAERLTANQRQVQLMADFHAEVVNGGWDQYLFNSAGDGANAFGKIAAQLGYNGIANALELISQRMGGKIPEDRGERELRLEELLAAMSEAESDDIYYRIKPDLDRIFGDLCEFVERNIDELSHSDAALRSNPDRNDS